MDKSYTKQVAINAPLAVVLDAVTTLSGLRAWWNNPVTGSPKLGGQLRFSFADSSDYAIMQVEAAGPQKVQWNVIEDTGYDGDWVGTKIIFKLRAIDQNKSELHFTHQGLTPKRKSYAGCIKGWDYFIGNLANYCEEKL